MMTFVLIPAGEFTMGSHESSQELGTLFGEDLEYFDKEHPAHRVRITRPFHLAKYPVTVGQFDAFVRATGYRTVAESRGGFRSTRGEWELDPNVNWRNPGFAQGNDHPVVCVSWNDAVAFCDWLSTREPKTSCHLPTEAEWEYACRAETTTLWSFGSDPSSLGEYAWYDDNSGDEAHPVGKKKPNAWGLYDTCGNVWEWCADWDNWEYYANSPVDDPKGLGTGSLRMHRGGSWYFSAECCRSACRHNLPPGTCRSDIGFRASLGPADK